MMQLLKLDDIGFCRETEFMAKIRLNPKFIANLLLCAYCYVPKSTTYFKNNGHLLLLKA